MFRSAALLQLLAAVSCWASLSAQEKPNAPIAGAAEFPVVLQQNVTAGKTPVGTKVQAKLMMATLVNGTVIPRNAILHGEVIESVVKTKTDPSRLAIRMDSADWKNGSATVKLFVTSWYYPTTEVEANQDLQYGPQQPANRTWNGQGQYPDSNSKSYQPFPGGDSDNKGSVPDTPSSLTSNHCVQMRDVQSTHNGDGAVEITSKRSNIKLDKLTTYVLAADDLPQRK
jgi:hypothetical protein